MESLYLDLMESRGTWSRLVEYNLVEKKFLVYEIEYIMMPELCWKCVYVMSGVWIIEAFRFTWNHGSDEEDMNFDNTEYEACRRGLLKKTTNYKFFRVEQGRGLVSPTYWFLWTIIMWVGVHWMSWFSKRGLVSPTGCYLQILLHIGVCCKLVLTNFYK